jgi:hypothetical protein
MALTLTSITPDPVPYNGGHLVELRGTFPLNTRLEAYIGLTGSNLDWRLHSGVAGQGDDLYALTEGLVRAYTPVMQAGGPYKVFVTAPDLVESDTLVGAPVVVVSSYRLSIYPLRSLFTPIYKVGPRRLGAVPPLIGS